MVMCRYIVNTFVQMFVSTFESLGVLVCAVGGRIDLSPSSSREIGASGEGGLRHDDADALKHDGDDADDLKPDNHDASALKLVDEHAGLELDGVDVDALKPDDAVGHKPDDEHAG